MGVREVFVFDQFDFDHYEIIGKLDEIKGAASFLAVTVREGARGIDFRG